MAMRLRYNIGWALLGNSVFAGAQWAIIILIARIGSPAMLGSYSLALAIATPIFMLANLNLRAYQATDIRDTFQFGEYLSVRLITSLIALCIVASLCLLDLVPTAHVPVVLAVSCAKALETLSDAFYGLFQRHEELSLVARSLILRGVLGFLGMATGLLVGKTLEAGAIGMATMWLLVMALNDVPRSGRFLGSSKLLLRRATFDLVRRAAPLGLVMLMLAVSQNIPTYVIEYFLGTEQLGFYASVAYFLLAGRIISNAVSQSSSPRLAALLVRGNLTGFRKLLRLNLLLGIGLGGSGVLISALLGRKLLWFVYGSPYDQYGLLLTCIMGAAGLGFLVAFLGASLTAARLFRAMVVTNALSLAATGVLCWWAIPALGLFGAPLALSIAYLLKITVNIMVIERFLRTHQAELCAGAERK